MQPGTRARQFAAVGTAVLLSACSAEAPTSPVAKKDIPAPNFALAGGLYVFNSQLTPLAGSGITASGHIQFKFPNDPVRNAIPSPPPIDILISGIIFNPDGNSLGTESGIYYSPGGLGDTFATLVAPLNIALPPSPIRSYSFDAAATISTELATQLVTDAHYTIRIGNLEGVLLPSGPPIVPSGPPI